MTGAARFAVQGWCPGAWHPMMSGDGLVVRVRPAAGRITRVQAAGIARAASAHGNGLIDLSARGNLQLRGVTDASYPALIADLRTLDLIDENATAEARRNLLVTPFADNATDALAARLAAALRDGPDLPGKFGFAVDTGPAPVLHDSAADIRLERAADGRLILRCDGMAVGTVVSAAGAADQAVALAQWFIAAGGVADGRGRMAALTGRGARPPGALDATPAPPACPPGPGLRPEGALVGLEFGQMVAETLTGLAEMGNLRTTPWRMLLVEGLRAMPHLPGLPHLPRLPGLILNPDNALRRVSACTGAPGCLQAHAPVRALARRLAPQVPPGRSLHVSGCAKGCAHPGAADVTLVASPEGFDRILHGTAQGAPETCALAPAEIDLKGLF